MKKKVLARGHHIARVIVLQRKKKFGSFFLARKHHFFLFACAAASWEKKEGKKRSQTHQLIFKKLSPSGSAEPIIMYSTSSNRITNMNKAMNRSQNREMVPLSGL